MFGQKDRRMGGGVRQVELAQQKTCITRMCVRVPSRVGWGHQKGYAQRRPCNICTRKLPVRAVLLLDAAALWRAFARWNVHTELAHTRTQSRIRTYSQTRISHDAISLPYNPQLLDRMWHSLVENVFSPISYYICWSEMVKASPGDKYTNSWEMKYQQIHSGKQYKYCLLFFMLFYIFFRVELLKINGLDTVAFYAWPKIHW